MPVQSHLDFIAYTGTASSGTILAHYDSDAPLKLRDLTEWPLSKASTWVISPTVWRLVQEIGKLIDPSTHAQALVTTMIGFAWPPLMLALAWYLYNRLSPDVPAVVAATCALTFAWVLVAPWALPWYASVAWVTLALLPRNSLTRWLTLATGVLSLLHFNGGHYSANGTVPTP